MDLYKFTVRLCKKYQVYFKVVIYPRRERKVVSELFDIQPPVLCPVKRGVLVTTLAYNEIIC